MARYNHFSEHKLKRVWFPDIEIGSVFSWGENPYRKCIKTGALTYIVNKTKEEKTLYHPNVYVSVKD